VTTWNSTNSDDEPWYIFPENRNKPKLLGDGICPLCNRPLDDHNGWLLRHGPFCPAEKVKDAPHKEG